MTLPTVQAAVEPLVKAGLCLWRAGLGVELRWNVHLAVGAGRHGEHDIAFVYVGPALFSVSWLRRNSVVRPSVVFLFLRASSWRRFVQLNLHPFKWHWPRIKPIHLNPRGRHARHYFGPVDLEVYVFE